MPAETTHYMDLDDLQLHYRCSGSGTPVLLIHGFAGSNLSWNTQMGPLAEAGWQALAIDLPGFGDTRQTWQADHSHDRYADVCARFLGRMGGAAHVVGHSMGAQVGLRLAINHPDLVKSFTVVDGAIFRTPLKTLARVPGALKLIRWLLHRRWADAQRLRHDLHRFYGFDMDEEVYAYYCERYQRREYRDSLIAHIRDASYPLPPQRLQAVSAPVHVVWGERDPVFPHYHAERFAEGLSGVSPRVVVTVIPGQGHMPQATAPDIFNQAMLSFLSTYQA